MTVFTLSPELEKRWYPFNIVEDMWADLKHMAGFDSPYCTVSDNDHSLRGHLADLGIDAMRLLPVAVIVALVVAGFMVLPVFGTNGNQPNTKPVLNAPVIVPPASNADEPLSWPATPTPTSSPTVTPTPTSTSTPTPTPVVFVSEGECDPIPVDLKESMETYVALKEHLEAVYGLLDDGQSTVPLGYLNDGGNWWTLDTWMIGITGAFALPQAEWEGTLKLPSNRYCMVGGQWYPLPPLPDGTRLVN